MARRSRTHTPTRRLHDDPDPATLVRLCHECKEGWHEACAGTVLEAWGQYAACGCQCGGGREAWSEGL